MLLPKAPMLLCEITLNDNITKYVSTQSVVREKYYSPQVTKVPDLKISGAGYVSVQFGEIQISNDPTNSESIFNYSEQSYPPEHKTYPIRLSWMHEINTFFEGSGVIQEITDYHITLELIPPAFNQELLETLHIEGENNEGVPEASHVRPMTFGTVHHRIPLKTSSTTLSNPYLAPQRLIEVYEDGVLIGNNIEGELNELPSHPDVETIVLPTEPLGEVSISGQSSIANTLLEVFAYIAERLDLKYDSAGALGAGDIPVSFYVESQVSVLEFADQVAQAFNHQFRIANGTFFLIDPSQESQTVEVSNNELSSLQVTHNFPTKRVESTWQSRTPVSGIIKQLGTHHHTVSANSSRFLEGKTESFESFVESEPQQQQILANKLQQLEKPLLSISISDLNFDLNLGSVLSFRSAMMKLNGELRIQGISYNFLREETTFEGVGHLSEWVQQ